MATVNRQLIGLISDDIIKPVKENGKTVYYMNPYVVHLGKKINLSTYEIFSFQYSEGKKGGVHEKAQAGTDKVHRHKKRKIYGKGKIENCPDFIL